MPWYIYSLAAGTFFYPGVALLAVAVLLARKPGRRGRHLLFAVLTVIASAIITVSAPALPFWFDAFWALATCGWLIAPLSAPPRLHVALKWLMLGVILTATLIELKYATATKPIAGSFARLYVVGDSVSAGIGAEHGKTWPVLIASDHHVEVVDLSRAGATLADARKRLARTSLQDGLMLLEIGGNDVLNRASSVQFANDLQSLIRVGQSDARQLVMLELPLLPFDDAYGIAQRRIAREHGVVLIPRRYFVSVLRAPDATVDGIHLTAAGQRRLEEMIWAFVGPGLTR